MYWTIFVTMLPPSLHPYVSVVLPECHAENQMRQLKDRLRARLHVPGEKVELGYGDGTGGVITVSDDDSVEEVVQAIVQVYRHRVGRVESICSTACIGLLCSLGEFAAAA